MKITKRQLRRIIREEKQSILEERRLREGISYLLSEGMTPEQIEEGFGDFLGDFWLGNDIIHQLTNEYSPMTLRIELEDFEDNWVYAEYAMFK